MSMEVQTAEGVSSDELTADADDVEQHPIEVEHRSDFMSNTIPSEASGLGASDAEQSADYCFTKGDRGRHVVPSPPQSSQMHRTMGISQYRFVARIWNCVFALTELPLDPSNMQ